MVLFFISIRHDIEGCNGSSRCSGGGDGGGRPGCVLSCSKSLCTLVIKDGRYIYIINKSLKLSHLQLIMKIHEVISNDIAETEKGVSPGSSVIPIVLRLIKQRMIDMLSMSL